MCGSVRQPRMYQTIKKHKTVVEKYSEDLISSGVVTKGDYQVRSHSLSCHSPFPSTATPPSPLLPLPLPSTATPPSPLLPLPLSLYCHSPSPSTATPPSPLLPLPLPLYCHSPSPLLPLPLPLYCHSPSPSTATPPPPLLPLPLPSTATPLPLYCHSPFPSTATPPSPLLPLPLSSPQEEQAEYGKICQDAFDKTRADQELHHRDWLDSPWVGFFQEDGSPVTSAIAATGVPENTLRHIGQIFSSAPDGFNLHKGSGSADSGQVTPPHV